MITLNAQIRELRRVSGLSQTTFAEKFEIPTRTLQDWEHNRRTPPIYVVGMIGRILSTEKCVKHTVGNTVLNKSKYTKANDEFYTTYETIAGEIEHYTDAFKNKIVLCNCDDPFKSNFSLFFIKNFNRLGIKKLICTSYNVSSGIISFENKAINSANKCKDNGNGYVLILDEVSKKITHQSKTENIYNYIIKKEAVNKLKGNGDFRSDECIEYLKMADIVVTNPPFSLFREWISLVTEYNKQFLVIGNQNAITYKEIFPLIQENKAWIGYQFGDMSFRVPHDSEPRTTRFWIDETGQKWRSLGNAMWLTNIDIKRRHRKLELCKYYDEKIYQKYDGYDAIEVPRVADIPQDYCGIMGVPITFLNKYNPDQFEIVGEANHGSDNSFDLFKPTVGGILKFKRILIRNKLAAGAKIND